MDIKVTEKQGYYVVTLKGSLDMYTSVELKSQTDSLSLKSGDKIILQLSDVSYIDSSGIGVLIKIVNGAQAASATVHLTGIKPMIEKIFKVAGLMSFFSFIDENEFKTKYPA
ncbi:MAG: putative anti-sigma factor antagonist [Turneriella sp.]|nr:putative anti-sigma factor antagonist [Turneriella sp.]